MWYPDGGVQRRPSKACAGTASTASRQISGRSRVTGDIGRDAEATADVESKLEQSRSEDQAISVADRFVCRC